MLAIEMARCFVTVEEHRAFGIDTVRKPIIVGAFYSRPAQILCDPSRIAPPVCKAELHAQIIAFGFEEHLIEMYKSFFVPLARARAKWMGARPIGQISKRAHVTRSTFAKSPNAHHAHSHLRSLPECLRHRLAILV